MIADLLINTIVPRVFRRADHSATGLEYYFFEKLEHIMPPTNPARNGQFVSVLGYSVGAAISARQSIPVLLGKIIDGEMWRAFTVESADKKYEFSSFRMFVEARSPIGLDTDIETLCELCRKDPAIVARIRELDR